MALKIMRQPSLLTVLQSVFPIVLSTVLRVETIAMRNELCRIVLLALIGGSPQKVVKIAVSLPSLQPGSFHHQIFDYVRQRMVNMLSKPQKPTVAIRPWPQDDAPMIFTLYFTHRGSFSLIPDSQRKFVPNQNPGATPARRISETIYYGSSGIVTGVVAGPFSTLGPLVDKWDNGGVFQKLRVKDSSKKKRGLTWSNVQVQVDALCTSPVAVSISFFFPDGTASCLALRMTVPFDTPSLFQHIRSVPASGLVVVGEAFLQWLQADIAITPGASGGTSQQRVELM